MISKRTIAPNSEPLEDLDIVIVTTTFFNAVVRVVGCRRVARVVFDEADSAAIPSCAAVNAEFVWFATASFANLIPPMLPMHVPMHQGKARSGIRSSGFIRAVFTDLGQTAISSLAAHALVVKCSDAFVDASLRLPEPAAEVVRCRAPAAVRVLAGLPDGGQVNMRALMACLNAGDVDGAMQHVSHANRGTEANIVAALMDKLGRQAHNFEQRIAALAAMEYETDAEREAEASRLAHRRDDLHERMAAIRQRVAGCDTCRICYETIASKAVAPCCSNAFCFACISRWTSRSPSCVEARQSVPPASACPR
jgi:hypothetical protein